MAAQLAVRLSDETVNRLDRLIRAGTYANRTEAVRAAIESLVADSERREVEAAIVAGYEKSPDAPEDPWLESATKALVSAEPW
jgi:Arc/MetJ-type ribon-helix-helix transcriptional regulator